MIIALLDEVTKLLAEARALNTQQAPTRSRELSLAITKLEEAKLWLSAAAGRVQL